jgi:hypothetical protein
MTGDERLLQIRRAHASARPSDANPAWKKTHGDLSFVLKHLDQASTTDPTAYWWNDLGKGGSVVKAIGFEAPTFIANSQLHPLYDAAPPASAQADAGPDFADGPVDDGFQPSTPYNGGAANAQAASAPLEMIRRLLHEFGEHHYHGCPQDAIPPKGPCECFAGALCNEARAVIATGNPT